MMLRVLNTPYPHQYPIFREMSLVAIRSRFLHMKYADRPLSVNLTTSAQLTETSKTVRS